MPQNGISRVLSNKWNLSAPALCQEFSLDGGKKYFLTKLMRLDIY
jgi:hypothetical protein